MTVCTTTPALAQYLCRKFHSLARRKALAVLLAGFIPMVLRVLLLPWFPVPQPRVQDEFSHLLIADTLAHGRLANPVHPMWVHFESMHILVRPVYASAFPVAQGAVMALAQVVTGLPWLGVWIATGGMCAALCWMLQAWVPPAWALLGALLAVARFGVFSYWMNSYYGGAVAAAAGALVLGALPRLYRKPRWQDAAIFGAALLTLANSRPYEGSLLALPACAACLHILLRSRNRRVIAVPLVLVLCTGAVCMGVYFQRITGSPTRLPYAFYRSTFTMAPHFVFQSARPEPVFHHRVLHQFHRYWEIACYEAARANRAPYGLLDKAKSYWRFYCGPFLTLPMLTLPWLWRRRLTRLLVIAGLFFCAGLSFGVWHAPHYAAPALGLFLLLAIQGLRHLRHAVGRLAVAVIVAGIVLTPVIGGGDLNSGGGARHRVLQDLAAKGGRHLVLVRYARSHDPGDEWVYNPAEIDASPVVFAREMDAGSNRAFVGYFSGRQVWLVQPDSQPPAIRPYDPSELPDPPLRFVRLGTEAIEVLRYPAEIKRKMLQNVAAAYPQPYRFGCDQWAYFFTQVTGVEAPELANGCFHPGQRGRQITFDEWFAWLERQR